MGKSKDLTNQRFGKLVAIKIDKKIDGRNYWLCKCDCGNTKVVKSSTLGSGAVISCGCEHDKYFGTTNNASLKINRADVLIRQEYNTLAARQRKKKFTGKIITLDTFKKLSFDKCFYCGKIGSKTIIEKKSKIKGQNRISEETIKINGIDRIDSSVGYTNENSISCCKDCNFAKGDKSVIDFYLWIKRAYNFNFQK